ncbi:MAG TPA: hypothetical protein VM118_10875 [Acidobacteriota bacterium]|nr:hypothetical protein [Acidobacteriota bacterium]
MHLRTHHQVTSPWRRRSAGDRRAWSRGLFAFLCLVVVNSADVYAFEPMPDIMQRLLQVFPERDGWFIEEPLGAAPQTPEGAQPFFATFRVVVPDVDAVELAMGHLSTAQEILPTHKITRYDRKPDAPGLPGFRGVWCRTEDDSLVGFSILTPNQNRFLIWAKYQYYPTLDDDAVGRKAREKYARDVSQYFASLDAGVPDTEPPRAIRQELPERIDLYPPITEAPLTLRPREWRDRSAEIRAWGLTGVVAFQPTREAIDRFIEQAPDTLWPNREIEFIQRLFRQWSDLGNSPRSIRTLARGAMPDTEHESDFFAVDRYGRVRFARDDAGLESHNKLTYGFRSYGRHAILFPGAPIRAGGFFHIGAAENQAVIERVSADAGAYYYSNVLGDAGYHDIALLTDFFVASLGHVFAALQQAGVSLEDVTIRKFRR